MHFLYTSYTFIIIAIRSDGMNVKVLTSWQIDGETVSDFIFGAPKSLQMVIAAMKLKDTYSLERKI